MTTIMHNSASNLLKTAINHEELLKRLQESYRIVIDQQTNEPISLEVTQDDVNVIRNIIIEHWNKTGDEVITKEAFRCLNNCIIKNQTLQKHVLHDELLGICASILRSSRNGLEMVQKGIYNLLINSCINSEVNGQIIWDLLLDEPQFQDLFKSGDVNSKILALTYNIYLHNKKINFSMSLINFILENVNGSEYSTFLIDAFVKSGEIFKYYIDIHITAYRITILQHIKELQLKNEEILWTKNNVEILTNDFKKKSDLILKTVSDYVDTIEPYEVTYLAEIIASLSANEKALNLIKFDHSLLINCAFLLKAIHAAGKLGGNHFTPIKKLSEALDLGDNVVNHPGFGFQVDMIRILGNLAHKTRCNQDLLRELDVIPLLLDCCNFDGRNPLVIQWVVFAIRNACENNKENQGIIASMNKKGVVDSAMLNEFGLTLEDDGKTTIKIAPFKTE